MEQYLEEQFMRRADQLASDALKLLLEGRDEFTPTTKSGWSRFIISLLHRNPENVRQKTRELAEAYQNRLLEIEAGYADFRRHTDPVTFEEFFAKMDSDALPKATAMILQSLCDLKGIGKHINGMHWETIEFSQLGIPFTPVAPRDRMTS